jgi:predicted transglutaminase-like cysteine proteinase
MKIRPGGSFSKSKPPKKAIRHRSGEALEVTRQLHGLLDAVDDAVGRNQSGVVNSDRVGAEEDWMGRRAV